VVKSEEQQEAGRTRTTPPKEIDAAVGRESEVPETEAGNDTPEMEAGHEKATGTGRNYKRRGEKIFGNSGGRLDGERRQLVRGRVARPKKKT
jgi:hypothetical protein